MSTLFASVDLGARDVGSAGRALHLIAVASSHNATRR
jgi:hypothetical protein